MEGKIGEGHSITALFFLPEPDAAVVTRCQGLTAGYHVIGFESYASVFGVVVRINSR